MNYDSWKTTNVEIEANEEIYEYVYNLSLEELLDKIILDPHLFEQEIETLYEAVAQAIINDDL